jgi:hypothetical protein
MSVIEHLKLNDLNVATLKEGAKVRIKHTGQIVELVRVSEHGISIVAFRTGGEYFISNNFLEPIFTLH